MGKISTIFIFLLMINIVGYILMTAMVEEGLAVGNPYVTNNTLLVKFYSPQVLGEGDTIYVLTNDSDLVVGLPQGTPESFIQEGITFVDRIFILFGFLRTIIGVILFPVALITFMGLPWQLAMLFFTPLMGLYILGIIDLLSGGNS